jgi:membrane-associated protease RseP (regulator of RpoE activity)
MADQSDSASWPPPLATGPTAGEIVVEEPQPRPAYGLALSLFVATLGTTMVAGALMHGADLVTRPADLVHGFPFALTLMAILLTHEMGHYITSRHYGVSASLPYFIPAPPILFPIGTFGAFINMRSPIMRRGPLLEIGAMGPIAGFVVAVVAVVAGLMQSSVQPANSLEGMKLGSPLLLHGLGALLIDAPPEGYDLVLHPVAFAGWIGLFVTALNLLPIGQLDGGHITYAVFGRRHKVISIVTVLALGVLGSLGIFGVEAWPGWLVWGILGAILGLRHPPVIDHDVPLTRRQRAIAWASVVIFVLTFTPVPFSV